MNPTRGIMLMTLAMLGFAIEDMLVKLSMAGLPVSAILFWLGAGGTLAFWVWCRLTGIAVVSRTFFTPVLMCRHMAEAVGSVAYVTAMARIDLTLLGAIFQALPLAVTMGAALFLHEPVGWRRWSAIIVGFIGVLIILRPGFAFDPNALWAVLAVIAVAVRDVASRRVPEETPSLLLACYGFAVTGGVGLVLMLVQGEFVAPVGKAGIYITAAVVSGSLGYYALVIASRAPDVGLVTPFRYTRLLFLLVIGIVVFGERPDALTFLGAAIIIASGVYTLLRTRRLAL